MLQLLVLERRKDQLVLEDAWLVSAAAVEHAPPTSRAILMAQTANLQRMQITHLRSPVTICLLDQFCVYLLIYCSRDASVSIVTRQGDGRPRNWGSISGRSKRFVAAPQRPDQFWGPLSLLWAQGVKWPGRESNHLPQSINKVKNEYSYISTPPIHLHEVLIK
jgi:hypothetical protein